jgi:hypothetical protein
LSNSRREQEMQVASFEQPENPMRKSLLALLFIPLLAAAAEPPPYDMAATPEATAIRQHALNHCRAAPSRTMREQIDCSLAAHRSYAVGTKLRDMSLFRDYATALRRAADDADAGRISPYEAQNRIVRAGVKFRSTVENGYQNWHRRTAPHGPLYDRAAFGNALKTRDAAVAGCGGWTATVIPTHIACIRKAERAFAAAIRLADMDLYYGYDSVLTYTAADAMDGRMTQANLGARHQQIWTDFLHTLAQQAGR